MSDGRTGANGMKGHIAAFRWGGGGVKLEAGFPRLLKMTANIEVKFTVPDCKVKSFSAGLPARPAIRRRAERRCECVRPLVGSACACRERAMLPPRAELGSREPILMEFPAAASSGRHVR